MKIHITKKEYRLLVEMLYLADWIMHSHAVGEDQYHREHEMLRKKILSHYKEMGAEDLIEYSEESNSFYETRNYDDYIHEKFIDPYDDETFWDELIERLARRDLINNIGIDKYKSMEGIERITKLEEVKERYANEFEQHGLNHVTIQYADLVKN